MLCHHAIMEAESVSANQYWELVTVNGRDVYQAAIDPGGIVHQFGQGEQINLGDSSDVDASRLYYAINVPQDCNYQIDLYTRAWDRIDGRADLGNDLWLRVATGSDIAGETSRGSDYHKMFSSNNSNFQWAQPDHGTRFCKRLPAGQHLIEIAARSYHFQIDRIVAWCKEGCVFDSAWTTKPPGDYNGLAQNSLSCSASTWNVPPPVADKQLPNSSLWQPGDVLALHYDIAPDLDDLHAIAAGCSATRCFGIDPCVVIGAHGEGREAQYKSGVSGGNGTRQQMAQRTATAAYGAGGYFDTNGESNWSGVVNQVAAKWKAALDAGNDIWLAEGGPSDFTRDVIAQLSNLGVSAGVLASQVHLVQHSDWNENETNGADLTFLKNNLDYIRIDDGNFAGNGTADLNDNSNLGAFRNWAGSSDCGPAWNEAFANLDPASKLDFSDTVELLHILGIGQGDIQTPTDFCNYFN